MSNPTSDLLHSHSQTVQYTIDADAYAAGTFTRCNAASDASSVDAIAEAIAEFERCKLLLLADREFCTADETATMVSAHPRIACVREACNAEFYPPGTPGPFSTAATVAYRTATNAFNAGTLTRCNAAEAASVTAANAEADATKTRCDTTNINGVQYCQAEQTKTKQVGAADAAKVHEACIAQSCIPSFQPGPPLMSPLPPCSTPPPPSVFTPADNAVYVASVTACNTASDAASVAAVAASVASLVACHVENQADPTECTADETETMLAHYPEIAATRATCIAALAPPLDYPGELPTRLLPPLQICDCCLD
jgi:hypothetical protein